MNNSILQNTLNELNIPTLIQRADIATIPRMIASRQTEDTLQPTPEKLPTYGFIFEKQGMRSFRRVIAKRENSSKENIVECFQSAYICWRALALLPDAPERSTNGHVSALGIHFVEMDIQEEFLPPLLTLAFRLSVAELLGERIAETRLDLERFPLFPRDKLHHDWRSVVAENIFTAFALLVRKANGWADIRLALQAIETLRDMQKNYEDGYLEDLNDPERQSNAAFELVGLYNLAQLITIVADYLQTGQLGYDIWWYRLSRQFFGQNKIKLNCTKTVCRYRFQYTCAGV